MTHGARPGRTALVTGGAGFIGRLLVDRLTGEGWQVRAIVRRRGDWSPARTVTVIEADLCASDDAQRLCADVDALFHLAGRSHQVDEVEPDLSEYRAINVDATRRLLDAAGRQGVRHAVVASSVKAQGETTTGCEDESVPPRPTTAYGRTKLEGEQVALDAAARFGISVACLRLAMVYGRGQKGNLARMMSAIAAGRFPPLPPMSNRRSVVHVQNVIDAALLAADRPGLAAPYIVVDRDAYSGRDLYDLLSACAGRAVPRWYVPAPVLRSLALGGDVLTRATGRRAPLDSERWAKISETAWYSPAKAMRELGYQARWSLADALSDWAAQAPIEAAVKATV